MSDEPTVAESDAQSGTLTIPVATAETLLTEVDVAIRRTGGPDAGAEEACSPLALARQRLEESDNLTGALEDHVIDILRDVSEERGVEFSNADPLVDATFTAKQDLESALSTEGDE